MTRLNVDRSAGEQEGEARGPRIVSAPIILPISTLSINSKTLGGDVKEMLAYVQDQVCRRQRGRLHFDYTEDRFIMLLDLDDLDRRMKVVLASQRAQRVWLVTKKGADVDFAGKGAN